LLNIARLEDLIKSKGWSKTYFAAKFGKNKGWISDMKRGIGLPDNNMICAIADELNTSVEYLTNESDQKEKPLVNGDKELTTYLDMLRTRPEMKMLFDITKDATKADVEKAVEIIEAYLKK